MVNQYETVFIVTPVLSDDQVKEAVNKFKTILTQGGAEITLEENWGLRKLAYPIKHKTTGFYNLIEFKAEGALINKLETEFRRDEKIIRFLTYKMDKYSVAYSDKKKKLKKEETN
jgi:small subunit ribosomal protein S6